MHYGQRHPESSKLIAVFVGRGTSRIFIATATGGRTHAFRSPDRGPTQ